MDEDKESVMVRMTSTSLREVDAYANRLGISRNAAIAVLTDIGLGHRPGAVTTSPSGSSLEVVCARVLRSVATRSSGTESPWVPAGAVRRSITSQYRPLFWDAVESLVKDRLIAKATANNITRLALTKRT